MKDFLKSISFIMVSSLFIVNSTNIAAATFSQMATYDVCFTPGDDCADLLVNAIDNAKQTLLVQAYSFTSKPILSALVQAKRRGVDVKVILDKSQVGQKYSSSTFLSHQGIPVWIDYLPAIAHNKVMIIDGSLLATGSYNFTASAQNRNAENLLLIRDKGMATLYTQNWYHRQAVSRALSSDEEINTSDSNNNHTITAEEIKGTIKTYYNQLKAKVNQLNH